MSFGWKDKPIISSKLLSNISVGLRNGIPAPVSWSPRIWLLVAIAIAAVVAGLLTISLTSAVKAASEPETPLECLKCHTRVLTGHDKLGTGSQACWVCHDNTDMGKLRLLDKTQLARSNSPPICGQCHTTKYDAWSEGKHGVVTHQEGISTITGATGLRCTACHDPHQPQMPLLTTPVLPSPLKGGTLDCLNCHVRVLKGHDKLGEGSQACLACHDNQRMGVLHLAGGETRFFLSDYPQLCSQCHQARYQAWAAGTHGVPSWTEEEYGPGYNEKVRCIGCHNPHQPQIVLTNITKPHPSPTPPPPPPPTELLVMVGISFIVVIGTGIIIVRQRGGP
ncbi:MAG: hypothetical protein HYY41_03715 [Chloroflexi bacterium]|nr:hypothetical protein [Chloroflexota bacterium]